MVEDGLEDVDKLIDPERDKQGEAMKQADVDSDTIGYNYLKVVNSVAFTDLSIKLWNFRYQSMEDQKSRKQKKQILIISLTMISLRK